EIFRGVFGNVVTGAVFDAPARDQIFKEGTALGSLLTLPSYMLQVNRGNVPANNKSWQYVGCKFVSLKVSGSAGTGADAIVTLEVGVIFQDANSNFTFTPALTFPQTFPVKFDTTGNSQASMFDDGTTDIPSGLRVRNFEVMVDNPHTAEERLYMGSLLIDEPLRKDYQKVTWKFTEEFFTRTAFDMYKAGTLGSPRIIFRHPTPLVSHSSSVVTVNAGNTITRGAGSFVSDGWAIGDSFDPSSPAAAFIPPGTYVTAVVALTLTVDQVCTSSGGTTTVSGGANREIELRSAFATLTDDPVAPVEGFQSMIATLNWESSRDDVTDLSMIVARIRSAEAALT
ncbi:MAG TPA: hypothetical protein VNF91_09665, partial [Candidatus Acidoferrum sp.]|nr:hypothetical protein [Candidatus Acidoferrum sp.]